MHRTDWQSRPAVYYWFLNFNGKLFHLNYLAVSSYDVNTDRSRLPFLGWSGTSRAINSATVIRNPPGDLFVLRYFHPQILCAQNMTSFVPKNRNSSPLSLLYIILTLVTRRRATLPTGRPLPEDSLNEMPHLLLPEFTIGFNWQQPRWIDPAK